MRDTFDGVKKDYPMKILFLHGLEGSPHGRKITFLWDRGFEVIAPELPRDDFKESIEIAKRALHENSIDVVIGSSRGGAIAMEIEPDMLVILLAPAWKNFGVDKAKGKERYRVFHSPDDKVVPFNDSKELPWILFEMSGDDHRLCNDLTLEEINEELFHHELMIDYQKKAKGE